MTSREEEILTVNQINKVVYTYYSIHPIVFYSKTRKREIAQARQIAMTFSWKFTELPTAIIGEYTGGKDHATVLHALKTVSNLLDTDQTIKKDYENLLKEVKDLLFKNEIQDAILTALKNKLREEETQILNSVYNKNFKQETISPSFFILTKILKEWENKL